MCDLSDRFYTLVGDWTYYGLPSSTWPMITQDFITVGVRRSCAHDTAVYL